MTRGRAAVFVALLATAGAACGGSTAKDTHALDQVQVPKTITITSPAFENGAAIPRANTCDGTGTPPTIEWGAVPRRTVTVAVVVDDPDAATTPNASFLHWLVIQLPPKAGSVPTTAAGVSELDNAAGTRGWTPPCPPPGTTHHYRFSVYALRDYVCADNGDASNGPGCAAPSSSQALSQIIDAAVAKGQLTGTYSR